MIEKIQDKLFEERKKVARLTTILLAREQKIADYEAALRVLSDISTAREKTAAEYILQSLERIQPATRQQIADDIKVHDDYDMKVNTLTGTLQRLKISGDACVENDLWVTGGRK